MWLKQEKINATPSERPVKQPEWLRTGAVISSWHHIARHSYFQRAWMKYFRPENVPRRRWSDVGLVGRKQWIYCDHLIPNMLNMVVHTISKSHTCLTCLTSTRNNIAACVWKLCVCLILDLGISSQIWSLTSICPLQKCHFAGMPHCDTLAIDGTSQNWKMSCLDSMRFWRGEVSWLPE